MDKSELETQAEKICEYTDQIHKDCFVNGYVTGALKREQKIADLKANFDYVLEGKDLELKEKDRQLNNWYLEWQKQEKEIKQLGERCNQLLKDKGNLTDKCRELEQIISDMQNANCTSCTDLGGMQLKIRELEKENAELKKKFENLQKYLDTQNSYRECAETWQKLVQAKEIIKKLLKTPQTIYKRDEDGEVCPFENTEYTAIVQQAEQFLKE